MRKVKTRKFMKRVVSVIMVVAMLVGMITFTSKPTSVEAAGSSASNEYYVGSKQVIRGVMDSINDLPQKQYEATNGVGSWKELNVGTYERPFTILELVPYEEYGELGFMIGGCEPLAMEKMGGHNAALNTFAGSMGTAIVKQDGVTYFFPDEPESQPPYYGQNITVAADHYMSEVDAFEDNAKAFDYDNNAAKGYYEVVKSGEGTFELVEVEEEDGTFSYHVEKKTNGNIIWHTMNAVEQQYNTVTYNQKFPKRNATHEQTEGVRLEKIGDRCYTLRPVSEEDQIIKVDSGLYYYYKNKEMFLTDVIGLQGENAINGYSVVYKAITPSELNATPEWADYADLIYINAYFHNGSIKELKKYWNEFSRLGHAYQSPGDTTSDPVKDGFKSVDDITYNATMHIFNKVTAVTNHAGLLIDDALFELFEYEKDNHNNLVKTTAQGWEYRDFYLNLITKSSASGYRAENLYKLLLMTCTVNPNIVKNIFLPHIHCAYYTNADTVQASSYDTEELKNDPKGKLCFDATIQSNQSNKQKYFWADVAFQLIDSTSYKLSGKSDPWNYLNDTNVKTAYWKDYNIQVNETFHNFRSYVQGRVYAYNSDTSIAQVFRTGAVGCDAKFSDYNNFLHTDADTKRIWETNNTDASKSYDSYVNQNTAPPSSALRYILGLGSDFENPIYTGELKILDIEPSTSLQSDNINPNWALKDDSSFLHMLLPNFAGTFSIDHYTMPAFVGKVDDLNSMYDLIYLGADVSGFNSTTTNGVTTVPDFYHDNTLDNKIYYHIGDIFYPLYVNGKSYNSEGERPFNTNGDSDNAREPGNDITKVKIGGATMHVNTGNFYEYMKAGYPIVAETLLFQSSRMDSESNMWSLISTYDYSKDTNPLNGISGVFKITDSEEIEKRVRENNVSVTFDLVPREYDYGTYNDTTFKNANYYLPTTGSGSAKQSYLKFKITVDNPSEYSYRFYVDQDKNGKFDASDLVIQHTMSSPSATETYPLSDEVIGIIQWRIEVYKTANESCRATRDGFSAAKNLGGDENKKQLRVLQIKPKSSDPTVDMTSAAYQKWYKNLDAFDISVDIMTWEQFNQYFKNMPDGETFKFDMGAAINATNPGNEILAHAQTVDGKGLPDGFRSLSEYNMLVFGFADMYGAIDMSNKYGAVEYIYYFAMSGKGSVLFSHDTTSMYTYHFSNDLAGGIEHRSYGSTANIIMRDIMGMNRYGTTSSLLTDAKFRTGLRTDLEEYRQNRKDSGLLYDVTSKNENQGMTYAALLNMSKDSQFTLKKMGNIGSGGNQDKGHTQKVKNLNRGQISEYPYNINEIISTATTHCQLYQLNMEDPELNVWYTLYPDRTGGHTTALVAASPQDAANQYYIYSKGNIFYTGVGHSGPQTDEEMQLFVNTMVAAYRAGATAPTVKVTNEDAVLVKTNPRKYSLAIPQEFNYDSSSHLTNEEFGDNYITVYFTPMDSNFSNDLSVWVYYSDHSRGAEVLPNAEQDASQKALYSITTVYDAAGGAHTATYVKNAYGSGLFIEHLQHGQVYHFTYLKESLKTKPDITFEVFSDRSEERGFAYLNIYAEPLFFLD